MLGINLDPSHMMVLGADPIAAARALKGCIFHVHGKDARIERGLADTDGLLEPRPVTESADRVWNYVAVGCGKDLQWWKEFFSVCHMMGYDGDVSLEMEDLTMTVDAGVHTSIDALRQTPLAKPSLWAIHFLTLDTGSAEGIKRVQRVLSGC